MSDWTPPSGIQFEPITGAFGSGETGGQPTPVSAAAAQRTTQAAPANADTTPATPDKPRVEQPEKDGAQLWLRTWNLTVGNNVGDKSVDLSGLAFEFIVEKKLNTTPYTAVITIYNIDNDTVQRMAKELTIVHLDAGYRPPSTQYGTLFHGPIVYYKYGRKDATDTYVEIHALQQDVETNRSKINAALPAGHTHTDVVKACIATMEGGKVKLGQYPPEMDQAQATRGRVLHGMTRDQLRDIARTYNASIFLDDAFLLHILKEGEAIKEGHESLPVLSSKSGLIGVPTQVLGAGVEIRSLLNSKLNPGHQLKVANKDINKLVDTSKENPSAGSGSAVDTSFSSSTTAPVANDGYYVVGAVRHWGHNRSNPWYSDVTTKPIDPSKPGAAPGMPTTV